jgi:hypothetical protein
MGTERFNRQFIMLDFADLDNPEFMAFVRSPEFSTYLIMRRYVWRSAANRHREALHEYYASGLLACALNREKLAAALGGVTPRQVSRDINALIKRGLVKRVQTGRSNVFILGKWAIDEEEDIYYEYYFLDRLQVRVDKNVHSDVTSNVASGQERQVRVDKNVQSDVTDLSTINIESNTEQRIETRSFSNQPDRNLQSSLLEITIETCSTEFGDIEHLRSNITRAYNLWRATELNEDELVGKIHEARRTTKQRISLSAIEDRDKKMPYFFAVLEDVLGLKDST